MKLKSTLLWSSVERCLLGENPLWDDHAATLYWIDVADPAVFRMKDATVVRYGMPKPVAAMFLGSDGHLTVALRQSLVSLNLETGSLTPLDTLRPPTSEERFNDGRCDHRGQIWISTMDRRLDRATGSLMRVSADLTTAALPTGAKLGNGVCFSPDGAHLYFADTAERALFRYPLAAPDAMPAGRTLFAQLDEAPGRPDGCSVDAEGCLWSARVGGGRIDRYAPDGRCIGYIETPVSHPTHCTFGGPGLATLFVTSSRYPADAPGFVDQPLAGAVLAFDVGAKGLAEHRFIPSGAGAAEVE